MQLTFMIMWGALIGSRRTAIVLALGLALAGCTPEDDSAGPTPTPVPTSAPSPATTPNRQAPASASTTTATPGKAISCLDGEWSFGAVQRQRVVSHVTEPLVITSSDPVQPPPLQPLRRVVAEVEGNAPPELAYARVRELLPPELGLPPLDARLEDGESGASNLMTEPGVVVFYELADVISVDYRYTCEGRPDIGTVTTWAAMGGGILRCGGSHPFDPPDIADVRAIACPRVR
ncbi:MAG TPA: hypothetical protein VLC50_00800 [Actinomycetes bacterium]|nr:hypothetical protein [Actinomycetes bacterium]